MADLEALKEAVIKGNQNTAQEITQQAIDEEMPPAEILSNGLIAGMTVVGEAFKKNEVYVPEVLMAARAMKTAMMLLEPKLIEAGIEPIGTVVIGTVQGDMHDIGKNLVGMMLKGAGFNVVDLGTNVAPQKFLDAATEYNAQIIALSALLTTTMPMMEATVKLFRDSDNQTKIMIGGAPVTQDFADKIGACGYSEDAASAVSLAKTLLEIA